MIIVQVRSIGKRDYNSLFKLGDEMIQFQGLHALLAAAVADMVPVNVGVLLSEDVKRQVGPHVSLRSSAECQGHQCSLSDFSASRTRLAAPHLIGRAGCGAAAVSPIACIIFAASCASCSAWRCASRA